ncbi:MAG: patatin-like phospholipase family protein [Alphaproteobacteria bacterium]
MIECYVHEMAEKKTISKTGEMQAVAGQGAELARLMAQRNRGGKRGWLGRRKSTKVFKVLAIDGGGIRGLVPARVLEEIEARTGKPIAEMFDMVAGTSTGGILATGLTAPDPKNKNKPRYSASDLAAIYHRHGRELFPPTVFRRLRPITGGLYDIGALQRVLDKQLGDTRMSDSLTHLVLPAYDIERRQPVFMRHLKGHRDRDFFMKDAASATAAAPAYFPPVELHAVRGRGAKQVQGERFALVDGGVVANNPSLVALLQAMRVAPPDAEIMIVSVGTGSGVKPISVDKARNWTARDWINPLGGMPLVKMVLNGSGDLASAAVREMIGVNYHRITMNFRAPHDKENQPASAMDDASVNNMSRLEGFAREMIRHHSDELDDICERLTGTRPAPPKAPRRRPVLQASKRRVRRHLPRL